MTDDALRALIATWNERLETFVGMPYSGGVSIEVARCRDEVAALLASAPSDIQALISEWRIESGERDRTMQEDSEEWERGYRAGRSDRADDDARDLEAALRVMSAPRQEAVKPSPMTFEDMREFASTRLVQDMDLDDLASFGLEVLSRHHTATAPRQEEGHYEDDLLPLTLPRPHTEAQTVTLTRAAVLHVHSDQGETKVHPPKGTRLRFVADDQPEKHHENL